MVSKAPKTGIQQAVNGDLSRIWGVQSRPNNFDMPDEWVGNHGFPLAFYMCPQICPKTSSNVHMLSHRNFMFHPEAARHCTSRRCPSTRNSTLLPLLRETLVTESSRLEARRALARSSAKRNCLGAELCYMTY